MGIRAYTYSRLTLCEDMLELYSKDVLVLVYALVLKRSKCVLNFSKRIFNRS